MRPIEHTNGPFKQHRFCYEAFVATHPGATIATFSGGQTIYAQGDAADALYYIVSGSVKISVVSEHGREGVVALLQAGDFFGEGCLSYRVKRASTVVATGDSRFVRIGQAMARRALAENPDFNAAFMAFLLDRNEVLKDNLLDQLFNSSEKRLARILLSLSNTGVDTQTNPITIPITQETLANMVGTTRSRISQFMTKFRKLGYIEYDGQIRVHNSLINVILRDQADDDTG